MNLPIPKYYARKKSKEKKRTDPATKKLLIAIYILYLLSTPEILIISTNGLVMVAGLSLLLFQSKLITESSYCDHYSWLIIASIILLAFEFLNIKFPFNFSSFQMIFQTKYIGLFIYFFWVLNGFLYLMTNRSLKN